MKKYFFILGAVMILLIPIIVLATYTQKKPPLKFGKSDSYVSLWHKIDSLQQKGLPQSAKRVLDTVWLKAQQDTNHPQIIKAIIHQIKFDNYTEEDEFLSITKKINAQISTAKYPVKPVLHSLLAEIYAIYFNYNLYHISSRSNTSHYNEDDLRTWSEQVFTQQIISEHLRALQNKDSLLRTDLYYFKDILHHSDSSNPLLSTLYDWLAYRSFKVFSQETHSISNPDWLDIKVFKKQNFQIDSMNFAPNASYILSQVLNQQQDDTRSFHFWKLTALQYIHQNAQFAGRDSLYGLALQNYLHQYKSSEFTVPITYALVQFKMQMAQKYTPLDDVSEKYRWFYKEAIELTEKTIELHPLHPEIGSIKYLNKQIQYKTLSSQIEKGISPNKPSLCYIKYKNVDTLYARIVSINPQKLMNGQDDALAYFFKQKKVKEWTITLPNKGDYQEHSTEILIEKLPKGTYGLLLSANKDFETDSNVVHTNIFSVSNLSYIARNYSDLQKMDVFVVDRENGTPISGAVVDVYYDKYNYVTRKYHRAKYASKTSNSDGKITLQTGRNETYNFFITVQKGDDLYFENRGEYGYGYLREDEPFTEIRYFTDRSIYRPGQTLHFKGIVLRRKGNASQIKPGFQTTLYLYDVNHQVIAQQQVKSNEFGSFSGSFNLPKGKLNGQMHISDQASNGSAYFQVEEYKRPKFHVEFKSVKEQYCLGRTVKVEGIAKSYNGVPITNAQVQINIARSSYTPSFYYCRNPYYGYSSQNILNKKIQTDDQGKFDIEFTANSDPSIDPAYDVAYMFSITADVTDLTGETRGANTVLFIGEKAIMYKTNVSADVEKNTSQPIWVQSINLMGEKVATQVKVNIYKLKSPSQKYISRYWPVPDYSSISKATFHKNFPLLAYNNEDDIKNWVIEKQVINKSMHTSKDSIFISKKELKNLPIGSYKVIIKGTDKFGHEVEQIRYFTLLDKKASKTPTPVNFKVHVLHSGPAEVGDEVEVLLTTNNSNLKILTEYESSSQLSYSAWDTLKRGSKLLRIPITENDRGNKVLRFVAVQNSRLYNYSTTIWVPWSNKELDIQLKTFRDKLYPGQKESWELLIKGPNKDKVMAEMMATMYDASLDAFSSHSFGLNLNPNFYESYALSSVPYSSMYSVSYDEYWNKPNYLRGMKYPSELNWFDFSWSYYSYSRFYRDSEIAYNAPMFKNRTVTTSSVSEESEKLNPKVAEREVATLGGRMATGSSSKTTSVDESSRVSQGLAFGTTGKKLQIRKNFAETAFFYPQLKTDKNGDIRIQFTMPEALTKYKLICLAHSKDLEIGTLTKEVVTTKDLMVFPYAPRFFRENDTISFSSKVSSLAKENQSGNVSIKILDTRTGVDVTSEIITSNLTQAFSLEENESKNFSWQLMIPSNYDLLSYQVVAQTGSFSDGEEAPIPILKNRKLITETLPLPIRGASQRSFSLDKLLTSTSSTLQHHQLALEFTSNPAWYAVQSIPYMMQYPWECSEQTFTRYYSNALAQYIAGSNEKIKEVFDQWKSMDTDALISNLEKNQDLKTVLLEESPWVMEAKSESERKKRIALLFDANKMSYELDKALTKLEQLQAPNGGWPWFEGMPDNRYITQHIVTGIGHLQHIGVISKENTRINTMAKKAIKYLDKRIHEDYTELKQNDIKLDQNNLSELQIHYLYMRSFFPEYALYHKKSVTYYLSQSKEYWLNQNVYMQGMIALYSYRNEMNSLAKDVLKSLKEKSIQHEELGMYFKGMNDGYYWYNAPVETQSLLIEAFSEVLNDQTSVDEMKIWLLKQKQTSNWKTTKATADACYALLLTGSDLLSTDASVLIELGGNKVTPEKTEAGTGYFRKNYTGEQITSSMGSVEVKKSSKGIAMGALYWQYFEDLDKITPASSPLKLTKNVFKQIQGESGVIMEPVSESTIEVGDKVVVQLVIEVDRYMEYVHLKDMRASGLQPTEVISGYGYQQGLSYYRSTKDASSNFFFSQLPRGKYVFEYTLRASHSGNFSNGISEIGCMYAPEFRAHSKGMRIQIQ